MILLIIIGIGLTAYGVISLKFPKMLKESRNDENEQRNKSFSWYMSIYMLGGIVSLVIGILLIIAGVVSYGQ